MADPVQLPEVATILSIARDITIATGLIIVVFAGHLRKWVYGWVLERADLEKEKAEKRAEAWESAFRQTSSQLDAILETQREIKTLLTDVSQRRSR
jgi:hypothetical protein